jgi:hypothetical protein
MVSYGILKPFNLEFVLVKFEQGLNRFSYYCEKIDNFIFVPIKEKLIPGYASDLESTSQQDTTTNTQPTVSEESIEKKSVKIAYIRLKTGFTAQGEFVSESNGDYTILMDNHTITFTSAEIESINIVSQ